MSKNCITCGANKRTGPDLKCDSCRAGIKRERINIGKRSPAYIAGMDLFQQHPAYPLSMIAIVIVQQAVGKRRGLVGTMPCPSCGTGIVHFSVANINGHIWGMCTSKNCLRWMQ